MSDAGRWLESGEEDLEAAELMVDNGKYNHAAFLYQQAVEKGLKAVMVADGEGLLQTHDCFVLAKKAEAPQSIVEQADVLSPYYFRTRYPDAAAVDLNEEDIRNVREAAEEVFTWIQKRF